MASASSSRSGDREVRDPWTRLAQLEVEVTELRAHLQEHLDRHKLAPRKD